MWQDESSAKMHGREQGKPGPRACYDLGEQSQHTDESGSAIRQLCNLGKVTYPLYASGFISKMRGNKGLLRGVAEFIWIRQL